MKTKKIYMAMTGAVLLLTACTSDELSSNQQANDGRIRFIATMADDMTRGVVSGQEPIALNGYAKELWLVPMEVPTTATTRGAQLNSESSIENFGVSAFKHAQGVDVTNAKPDYFYNLKATKSGTTYSISQDYYWPSSSEYLTFQAYYPYNSGSTPALDTDSTKVVLSPIGQTGSQTINFTVSETAAYQTDLMTAVATNQTAATAGPSVSLAFHHQLCGIRFITGGQFALKGYIQKITLKNVYKSGTYNIGTGAWSNLAKGDFSVSYTADEKLNGDSLQNITREGETFLMIPTTFVDADGAEVEIDFWDGFKKHTVSASLTDHTWTAGQTITYALSSEKLTTLQISDITFASTVSTAPKTEWADGDQVGLYVVHGVKRATDPAAVIAGKTLRYSNVCCTYDGTTEKWSVATVDDKPVIMYPGDSYYLYYPYKEGNPDGYPNECNTVGADAETFFSSVINARVANKADYANQEDFNDFNNADLQVAKATVPTLQNDLAASTISAAMERQVGLAHFMMATAHQTPINLTYTDNSLVDTPTETVAPTTNFSGNTPYTSSNNCWFYTTNIGSATTFRGLSTDPDTWDAINITISNKGETNTTVPTVYSVRNDWTFINSVIYNYTYTGASATCSLPYDGTYRIECWGAGIWYEGGNYSSGGGGGGGYVAGDINLTAETDLYVYVGDKQHSVTNDNGTIMAFNGGGSSYSEGVTGAGATDVRMTKASDSWGRNDINSLRSRIIVAGGGSLNGSSRLNSGSAGGCRGYQGRHAIGAESYDIYCGQGGGQTSGGAAPAIFASSGGEIGHFGYGGRAGKSSTSGASCGGGGGWYGASGASGAGNGGFYGGGGSSFISGHPGCNGINASGVHQGTGQSSIVTVNNTATTITFTNMLMIDGGGCKWTSDEDPTDQQQMPNPAGGYYNTGVGHHGTGYARITYTRQ